MDKHCPKEEFEDTKCVIRIRKSMTDKQPEINSDAPEGSAVPAPNACYGKKV